MSPPHDSPPSSMPSPNSRRPSEVVDVEWIEVEGVPPPRSPEPPVDLAARARGRAGRRGQGARRSRVNASTQALSSPPCVFCKDAGSRMILVPGLPLAVPVCARCERLSSLALRILR
jgi:hypothetical protein